MDSVVYLSLGEGDLGDLVFTFGMGFAYTCIYDLRAKCMIPVFAGHIV